MLVTKINLESTLSSRVVELVEIGFRLALAETIQIGFRITS